MPQKKSQRKRSITKPSRIDTVRDLVGVLTDAEVAAKAGVTSSAVHQYRQRHGIKPALPQGTTRRAVERRKTDESSTEGANQKRVARTRRSTVTTVAHVNDSAPAEGGRRSRIDDVRHLVGVLTDPEVAHRAGVTRTAVQMYRKKHGIAPAGPPGDPAVARSRAPTDIGSNEAPGSRRSGPRSFAFRVRVAARHGEVQRIVVAESLVAAAERAHGLGDIVLVEKLGEAM